ncbi:molybdate ABC transporter permease subunit [Schlesneria sp. T3-172]|uniref:molybdate ABC transporter permease subunit n=1 Tax=Schlesneria sphaerica TaxID=3373610 RepID=UPI0037CC46DE
MDWGAIWLSLKLASAATSILFVAGIPLSYWLATTRWRGRFLVEAVVALPLVLPPTVLGFYLLVGLGPHGFVGKAWHSLFGARLPFSFPGILIGAVLFNLPFAIRPFTAAFSAMDRQLVEAAWCLGVSRFETFRRVILPLCWPGILAGVILTFAHTIGEFGVVLMLGGNIPSVTRTISTSLYDDVQSLNYVSAGRTAGTLLGFSFVVLCITQWLTNRSAAR